MALEELLEEQKRLQEAKEASRVQQKAIEDFLQRCASLKGRRFGLKSMEELVNRWRFGGTTAPWVWRSHG